MAKFTVFFKDAPIQSELYDSGTVNIGRDSSNNLVIDSLAIAPTHAVAVIDGDEVVIRQMNEEFPLLVNGQKVKECSLHNNDKIAMGKHVIVFNTTEFKFAEPEAGATDQPAAETHKAELPDANLQILSGQHIGKLIPLKKAMTRLGSGKNGIAIISKRRDGYFLSALENHPSLKINNQLLGEHAVKLNNNDKIVIDNTPMQFFHS